MQHVKQEDTKPAAVPTRRRDPRGAYKRKAQPASDARHGQQARRGEHSQGSQWNEMSRSYSEGAHQQSWTGANTSPLPQVCSHLIWFLSVMLCDAM